MPRAELVEAERRADELRAKLRQRRGTTKRLRVRNQQLQRQTQRAQAEAHRARAALAASASLPRRVVRRLRARSAEPSA